ncbi:transposase [Streptomyces sp. FXJ1.172]|nr:transposase [Streptomyces sp. FXJ1.172]WEO92858.1 transposase [Streptomyces sp. FXJ1.172]
MAASIRRNRADSGDRKDVTATTHVGRQWLGRLGKTDNGVVTVTTVWTDGRVYYPLHATPYTPAHHFDRGRLDPAFRTKPQLAAALAARGKEAGFGCRAVVADCAYSVSDDWYLALREAGLAYVVALKPHRGTWARADQPHTPIEAAHALAWKDARRPGDWTAVERHFRDGHTETWWAADARLGGYGPDSPCRLVVATTDPATLPEKATWYLATNLPHPEAPHATTSPHPPADLAELQTHQGRTRLGRRPSPFRPSHPPPPNPGQLRLSFCWGQWFAPPGPLDATAPDPCPDEGPERGPSRTSPAPTALLVQGLTGHPFLAHSRRHPHPMVASLDGEDFGSGPICSVPVAGRVPAGLLPRPHTQCDHGSDDDHGEQEAAEAAAPVTASEVVHRSPEESRWLCIRA